MKRSKTAYDTGFPIAEQHLGCILVVIMKRVQRHEVKISGLEKNCQT